MPEKKKLDTPYIFSLILRVPFRLDCLEPVHSGRIMPEIHAQTPYPAHLGSLLTLS